MQNRTSAKKNMSSIPNKNINFQKSNFKNNNSNINNFMKGKPATKPFKNI